MCVLNTMNRHFYTSQNHKLVKLFNKALDILRADIQENAHTVTNLIIYSLHAIYTNYELANLKKMSSENIPIMQLFLNVSLTGISKM